MSCQLLTHSEWYAKHAIYPPQKNTPISLQDDEFSGLILLLITVPRQITGWYRIVTQQKKTVKA